MANAKIQIRVEADERAAIKRAAADAGLSMSAYLLRLHRRKQGDIRCRRCRRIAELVRGMS